MRIVTARNRGRSYWEMVMERESWRRQKLGVTEHESCSCWVRLENQVVGKEVEITRRDPRVKTGVDIGRDQYTEGQTEEAGRQ